MFAATASGQLPPGKSRVDESPYLTVGREELNRGHFETAVVAFQKARAEDSDDPEAPLGLAQALNHLGRHEEAAEAARASLVCWRALESVEADRPDIPAFEAKVEFELGYALYHLRQYPAAIEELERARDRCPTDGYVRFTLGLALYYSGNRHDDAAAEFSRAIDLAPPLADSARAMRGLCYRRLGRIEEARRDLSELAALKTDSALAAPSRSLLDVLHGGVSARSTTGVTLSALTWYEHDSNLLLSPDSGGQRPSRQSDHGLGFLGNLAWRPESAPRWVLAYSLFTKVYADTQELDLLGNLGSISYDALWSGEAPAEGVRRGSGAEGDGTDFTPGEARLKFQIETMYYHLDWEAYLWRNAVLGRLEIPFGSNWAGRLELRAGHKGFQDSSNDRFDGPDYGGRLGWELHDVERTRALVLEYHAVVEETDAKEFDNLAQDVGVSVRIGLPGDWEISGTGSYGWREYANRDALLGTQRSDRWASLTVGLSKAITEDVRVALEWTHTDQDSNVNAFEYDRDLVLLSAWFRF
ncbi:MAG: tetratricopeptide repeat protein [Planctomycetes bacterium]|nr:tetratricopeptide repeat protein [Planctomycetota bacterium]